ncbi:hypothetical protein [Vibrio fortis]|uniref:hypothetical protein n=1 Tax=Vibrio fortis TaxID=212667 RepID=UPI004068883F
MWQTAALADALAAMAAEKVEDPVAYEYWSNSVRYFLMGGSNWNQYRQQLQVDYKAFDAQFSIATNSDGPSAYVDDAWIQFSSLIDIWDQKLNFFRYESPSAGLIRKQPANTIPTASGPRTSGEQLKQYTPNSKLMLNKDFSNKQTFIVEPTENPVTEKSVIQEQQDLTGQIVTPKGSVQGTEGTTQQQFSGGKVSSTKGSFHSPITPVVSQATAQKQAQQTVSSAPLKSGETNANSAESGDATISNETGVTVITPLGTPEVIVETNVSNTQELNSPSSQQVATTSIEPAMTQTPVVAELPASAIPKGNLGQAPVPAVQAIQRRSFAPVEDNQ